MNPIIQWWQQREIREKKALAVGGILLGIVLVIELIVLPISHGLDNLKAEVIHQKTLLAWITQAEIKIKRQDGHGKQHTITHQALLSTVSSTLKQHNLTASVMHQDNKNSVNMTFNEVTLNDLLRWLHQLLKGYNVTLERLSLSQTETQGIVKADLTLSLSIPVI